MDWIVDILKHFGLAEGLFAIFFVGAHIVIRAQYKETVRILERENKRLSAENARLLERDDLNMARTDKLHDKIADMVEARKND